jgi:outer membrane protein insertion porin family
MSCRWLVAGAIAGVTALGCGGPAAAPKAATASIASRQPVTLDELRGPITAISVVGLDGARQKAARDVIHSEIGKPLDRAQVRRDVRALWALGGIADVVVEGRLAGEDVELSFVVSPRPTLAEINLDGAVIGPRLFDPRSVFAARRHDVFDPVALNRGRNALLAAYRELGFLFADVTWQVAAGKDGALDLTIKVVEGQPVTIRSIDFKGNRAIAAAELATALTAGQSGTNVVGARYARELVEAGLLHINASYFDQGYINVRVGPVDEQISEDKTTVALVVPVVEGDQFRLGKIEVRGALIAPAKDYLARLGVKRGQVLSRSKLADGMRRIVELHREQGKAEPNLNPVTSIDPSKKIVDLVIEVGGTGAAP